MTDRYRHPPAEPDDDPHGVDRDLWHENQDGSYFDRFPPYTTHYPNRDAPDRGDETNRYTMPDFDPTGEHGPRDLFETTVETQHRYLNGPERAGLPGYVVIPGGGCWTASGDGSEWVRVEQKGEPR